MQVGLNNRVLSNLSQSSSKAAVDLLGMKNCNEHKREFCRNFNYRNRSLW